MLKYLLCFVFFLYAYGEETPLSTPERNASLRSGHLIGGVVSPVGGLPVLKQTDLVVKGAGEINLTRYYIPPVIPTEFQKHRDNQKERDNLKLIHYLHNHYYGWKYLPHMNLILNDKRVRLIDPTGAAFDFELDGTDTKLVGRHYGISNWAGDEPSGTLDPRNTRISCENNRVIVIAPDGTRRIYLQNIDNIYTLKKEVLPNGKILKYHQRNDELSIQSMDRGEKFEYAELIGMRTPTTERFITSTGSIAEYHYERKPVEIRIKSNSTGTVHSLWHPRILKSVSSPFYRQEEHVYNDKHLLSGFSGKDAFAFHHAVAGPNYRVEQLLLPVGQEDTLVPVYEMNYVPPVAGKKEGFTSVNKKDGTSMVYRYSKDLLLTSIQYFQDDELKKEELFT